MRSVLTKFAAGLALSVSLAGVSAYASETAAAGDPAAGQQKSATCIACHMADGNSVVPTFPKLAGQQPGYIAAQLAAFKSGARQDATMQPMASALSEQDMLDLDAYYSSQSPAVGSITAEQEESARAGETVYRAGIAEYKVAACMACHGPSGKGVEPNFPRLSGQHAAYVEKQLLAFKDGSRTDPMMNDIAYTLSAQQIKDLATYISALY